MGRDTTFLVNISRLTMNFKVIILVYQITIFSQLIEGSPYEESSPTVNGCNMKDKMSSPHNEKHITFIENTTNIIDCAFHCKVDARCNFWTLHTDNKYCDLFREEGDLREDINAKSGSKDCGGKPTEHKCKSIASFSKDCPKNTDEEHCRALLENFEENCRQCNLRDKMSWIPNGNHKIFLEVNNTNVFECAYHCKVDARCQYWTFEKDNKYCDLFGEEGILRKDVHAISGSKYCAGKPNVKLCMSIESFVNDCKENSLVGNIDEEHCQAVSDNFDKNCNTSSSSNNTNTTTPNPLCTEYKRIDIEECRAVDRGSEHCQGIFDLLQDYCHETPDTGYLGDNQTATTQTTLATQPTLIGRGTPTTGTTPTTLTISTIQTTSTTQTTTTTKTTTTTQTTTTTRTTFTTQTTISYQPTTLTKTMPTSQTYPTPSTISSYPPTSLQIYVCNAMIDAVDECKNNMILGEIMTEQCMEVRWFVVKYCDYYYDDVFGGSYTGLNLNFPSNLYYPKDPNYNYPDFPNDLYDPYYPNNINYPYVQDYPSDPDYSNNPDYLNDPNQSKYPIFQNTITRQLATLSYFPGYYYKNTCNFDYSGYIKNIPTNICLNTFKAVEHCGFGKNGAVDKGTKPCQDIWNMFKKFCGYFDQPCISDNCQNLISIGEMCAFGSYAHPAIPADEACRENSESFKMRCGYNY